MTLRAAARPFGKGAQLPSAGRPPCSRGREHRRSTPSGPGRSHAKRCLEGPREARSAAGLTADTRSGPWRRRPPQRVPARAWRPNTACVRAMTCSTLPPSATCALGAVAQPSHTSPTMKRFTLWNCQASPVAAAGWMGRPQRSPTRGFQRASPEVFRFGVITPMPGWIRSSQSWIPFGLPFRTEKAMVHAHGARWRLPGWNAKRRAVPWASNGRRPFKAWARSKRCRPR